MFDFRKYIAEGLGTMFLVLMGCGSAVIAGVEIGNVGIALAFGLTVLVMVYAIGPLTGCHINPAITVAMWVDKKIDTADAAGYITAQFVGALIGSALLYMILNGQASYNLAYQGLGQNGFGAASPMGYGLWAALLAEFIFTALFLFVICGATSAKAPKGFAGVAIGLCLVLIHIVGIPVTGVSVNPARSFGPAMMMLFNGDYVAISQLWVFIVAPVLGGLAGLFMYKLVSK